MGILNNNKKATKTILTVKLRGIGEKYGEERIANVIGIRYGVVFVEFELFKNKAGINSIYSTEFSTFDGTQIPYKYDGYQLDLDSLIFDQKFYDRLPAITGYSVKAVRYQLPFENKPYAYPAKID